MSTRRTFDSISISKKSSFPIYYGQKYYYRLVISKDFEVKREKALMEDYNLTDVSTSLVVCYTPDENTRLFSIFPSYVEFYTYIQKFDLDQRCFYEIIFGELPRKPYFDIDISDRENLNEIAETLREAVIKGCIDICADSPFPINIEKDILIYSSHGKTKRSFHLIINNKYHDGNKASQAFYRAVMERVKIYTEEKYLECVDKGVYSPTQQFRIAGNQKYGSGRVKVFYERFSFDGKVYNHIYDEDVTNPNVKKLVILRESLISFASGCSYLPSLIKYDTPARIYQDTEDMNFSTAQACLKMLREKMNPCPFTITEIRGSLILLKRHAPSRCPICIHSSLHENENPYMLVNSGGVYWDCRRSIAGKRFFVGYLEYQPGMVISGENEINYEKDTRESFPEEGKFNFLPEENVEVAPVKVEQITLIDDVKSKLLSLANTIAKKKNKDPGDLSNMISFQGISFQ